MECHCHGRAGGAGHIDAGRKSRQVDFGASGGAVRADHTLSGNIVDLGTRGRADSDHEAASAEAQRLYSGADIGQRRHKMKIAGAAYLSRGLSEEIAGLVDGSVDLHEVYGRQSDAVAVGVDGIVDIEAGSLGVRLHVAVDIDEIGPVICREIR